MAIHPRYAGAIMAGRKRVEFRKRGLAEDIATVVVYATAPVGAIVGTFDIDGTVRDTPAALWQAFGAVGSIPRDDYDRYYGEATVAVAFRVTNVRRYDRPVPLGALSPAPSVPQSFCYLGGDVLAQVEELGRPRRGRLHRVASVLHLGARSARRRSSVPT